MGEASRPRAASAGQAGFLADREPTDAASAITLVRLVGSLLREQLDDAIGAFHFWQKAVKTLRPEAWKAECEIEAADLAINDLAHAEPAKTLLDSATKRLEKDGIRACQPPPARLGRLVCPQGRQILGPGRLFTRHDRRAG